MSNNFVFNHLSLPAASKDQAYTLFKSIIEGMLQINQRGEGYRLFSECRLSETMLFDNYTYLDFVRELDQDSKNKDLCAFLLELEDKTPLVDHLTEEQFQTLSTNSYYFYDEPYTHSIDILGIAWNDDAILLSIPTDEKWSASQILIGQYEEHTPPNGSTPIPNISTRKQGIELNEKYSALKIKSLAELFPNCAFTERFIDWLESQDSRLREKIISKIAIAHERNFDGGKPLLETLSGNNSHLREIRLSAIHGGAPRILFASTGLKIVILTGFVKHDSSEGYTEAIAHANAELENFQDA